MVGGRALLQPSRQKNPRERKKIVEDVCLFVTRKKGGALHTKRLAHFFNCCCVYFIVSLVLLILLIRAMMVRIVRNSALLEWCAMTRVCSFSSRSFSLSFSLCLSLSLSLLVSRETRSFVESDAEARWRYVRERDDVLICLKWHSRVFFDLFFVSIQFRCIG